MVVSIFYPAYQSHFAIQTKTKTDDKQWLTYWIIFGFFQFLEFFLGFIVYFFPFYWEVKSIFVQLKLSFIFCILTSSFK
jgi:receptor expression-enhancing protein 5/6